MTKCVVLMVRVKLGQQEASWAPEIRTSEHGSEKRHKEIAFYVECSPGMDLPPPPPR